jgi:hypothetical protein
MLWIPKKNGNSKIPESEIGVEGDVALNRRR